MSSSSLAPGAPEPDAMILWGPEPNIRYMSGIDRTTWACRLWHLSQGEWSQGLLEMSTFLSKPFTPVQMWTAHHMKVLGLRAPGLLLDSFTTALWLWTSHSLPFSEPVDFPFLSLNSLLKKMKKSFVLKDSNSNSCPSFLNLHSLGSLSTCLLASEAGVCVQLHYLETPLLLVRQVPSQPPIATRSGGCTQPASVYPSSGFPLGDG